MHAPPPSTPSITGAAPVALHALTGAVQRHLWRKALRAGLRGALWTAGLLGVVLALGHLLLAPWGLGVPAEALWVAVALPIVGALAWVGRRRPSEQACAHWADRHLGGASAYSTWLEGEGTTLARERLSRWLAPRVANSLQQLAGQPSGPGLGRPALVLGLVLGVALLALQRPPARTAGEGDAGRDAGVTQAAQREPGVDASLAQAFSEPPRQAQAPARHRDRAVDRWVEAPTEAPTEALQSSNDAARKGGRSAPSAQGVAGGDPSSKLAPAAPVPAAHGLRGGGGEGRGDAADAGRKPAGASPASERLAVVQRPLGRGGEQAIDQAAAAYDEVPSAVGRSRGRAASVQAARAPLAGQEPQRSPTEREYLQAWHQARPR